MTIVFHQDGAASGLNHAQMAAAEQYGAKDFWLSGAMTTETKYKLPAEVMQQMLAGGKPDLKRYKVSNRMKPITDTDTLRLVITRAYLDNSGKARSAAVPRHRSRFVRWCFRKPRGPLGVNQTIHAWPRACRPACHPYSLDGGNPHPEW